MTTSRTAFAMTTRTYGLPCAWHYHPPANITVRWGRPDHAFTVHRGNQRGTRDDHALIATVPVAQGWLDDNEVARKACAWVRANPELVGGRR
ncbi:hypothetical protein [Saccharopolyspora gregorii]|uniref:hypothetical protein n=1 Tax=Saccharopolyspora gregorii TaxID=33914 RepID=UPI0021AC3C09|nr:hypothetical protein [Saccharopolyspora gregorii]